MMWSNKLMLRSDLIFDSNLEAPKTSVTGVFEFATLPDITHRVSKFTIMVHSIVKFFQYKLSTQIWCPPHFHLPSRICYTSRPTVQATQRCQTSPVALRSAFREHHFILSSRHGQNLTLIRLRAASIRIIYSPTKTLILLHIWTSISWIFWNINERVHASSSIPRRRTNELQ